MFKAPVPKFSETAAPPPPPVPKFSETATAPPPPKPSAAAAESGRKDSSSPHGVAPKLAYEQPDWKGIPKGIKYGMEVIKGGVQVQSYKLCAKSCYTFGRQPDCDVVLDHPSSSRVHAVLQYRKDGASFIYDNKSTHGTFINKGLLKAKVYAPLRVGDVLRFGQSSRLYIFQGPSELMPAQGLSKEEADEMKRLEAAAERKVREEQVERASALRAEASWGLGDDLESEATQRALEEEEEQKEGEVDWRSKYEKGQLTEKQTTMAERIRKKERTMANLKSEAERIKVKESSQQLTEGQQMQMVRNQKRLLQIQEEIDGAEGLLLDSMNEALLGKSNKQGGAKKKRKKSMHEEDGQDSDEDTFYDRTEKKPKKARGGKAKQQAETIESLWERHGKLTSEKEGLTKDLQEKVHSYRQSAASTSTSTTGTETEDDSLDAYLLRMKNQAKQDQISKLQDSLAKVQQEITRAESLIKIADPMGAFKALKPLEEERKAVAASPTPPAAATATTAPPPKQQKDAAEFKAPMPVGPRAPVQKGAAEFKAPLPVARPTAEKKKKEKKENSVVAQEQGLDTSALDLISILQGAHRGATAASDVGATENEESTWMPPSNQSGDGTTSLNKRLGY